MNKYVPHILAGFGVGLLGRGFGWPLEATIGCALIGLALLGTIQGWAK